MATPSTRSRPRTDPGERRGVKRPLFLVLAATVLLVLWNVHVGRAEERLRVERSRVGRLLTPEERQDVPMAAVKVELGGRSLLYGRFEGLWRCREYHLAPADTQAIESLFQKLTEAEGVVVTSETSEAPTYGINTPETIRVYLCGRRVLEDPAGDVLFAFDIGKAIPGRDGGFVRRRGTKEIWAIDSNPRLELERPAPDLPPMLARGVVPRAWPGWRSGFQQVFVDRRASGFELTRSEIELEPEALQAGQVPWKWMLATETGQVEAASGPAVAYSLFLQKIPYVEVLPREERQAHGIATPAAVVTLAAAEGEPLEVILGPPRGDGRTPIWVPFTQTLYLVDDQVAELVAPDRARFAPGSEENPWDPYLRQATNPSLPSFNR